MREIKFKVWDCQNNRWAKYSDCRDSIGMKFGVKDYFINIAGEKAVRFAFCQYTGLKDKDGKEIYEGDIWDKKDSKGIIIFEESCFQMKWQDGHIDLLSIFIDEISIIGNIYEPPELLNQNIKQ